MFLDLGSSKFGAAPRTNRFPARDTGLRSRLVDWRGTSNARILPAWLADSHGPVTQSAARIDTPITKMTNGIILTHMGNLLIRNAERL